jgi:hypothetical protein
MTSATSEKHVRNDHRKSPGEIRVSLAEPRQHVGGTYSRSRPLENVAKLSEIMTPSLNIFGLEPRHDSLVGLRSTSVIHATQILRGARGVVVQETVKHAVLRSVVVEERISRTHQSAHDWKGELE